MKLVDLLNLANRGYPDGFLAEYYDSVIGGRKRGSGDTLAEFIVKELTDTFDDEADDETQIDTAVHMLEPSQRTVPKREHTVPNPETPNKIIRLELPCMPHTIFRIVAA